MTHRQRASLAFKVAAVTAFVTIQWAVVIVSSGVGQEPNWQNTVGSTLIIVSLIAAVVALVLWLLSLRRRRSEKLQKLAD